MSYTDDILDIDMEPNDSGADTIRGYLVGLAYQVWVEDEGFSGKRPFGNSDWKYDVYKALIDAGVVNGTLDEYGYIENFDEEAADKLILSAIVALM